MNDLVKWLRSIDGPKGSLHEQAADRIEQQEQRIAELEGALSKILEQPLADDHPVVVIASKALEKDDESKT